MYKHLSRFVGSSQNPLTAKVAKILRKGRKELIYGVFFTLRALRLLSVLCG